MNICAVNYALAKKTGNNERAKANANNEPRAVQGKNCAGGNECYCKKRMKREREVKKNFPEI